MREEIFNGYVHTIDEMKAWLQPLGYSDAIKEAAIIFILREFVMREVSTDNMMNMDMVVEHLRLQLEVTKEDIEPINYHGIVPSSQSYWFTKCINKGYLNRL